MTSLLVWALWLAESGADPCAAAAAERAPNPRCGETLDGRAPAEPSTARKVGQAAFAVPRAAAQVAFWPVVKTADVVESNHVADWARADPHHRRRIDRCSSGAAVFDQLRSKRRTALLLPAAARPRQ